MLAQRDFQSTTTEWPSRRWLAVVLCAALVLVQAGFACARPTGELTEICSDTGVAIVRIDIAGNVVEQGGPRAPGCDSCRFCATLGSADLGMAVAPDRPDFPITAGPRPAACSLHCTTPDLWPETRGPPSDSKMTLCLFPVRTPAPVFETGRPSWT
ncbi:hypothetical protein AB0T83_12000 [Fluviibacterium sp. DFM31]|uniref:Uncharacterized protein n=1 Tax=Meridianimarinicoccus marinus TaxID=3231483 RepID=A0ABV3L7F1_9RHOB